MINMRHVVTLASAAVCLCAGRFQAVAQQPSAADILEYRVPAPPAVGTRELDVGFETAAPIANPSVLKAADGRFMMIA